MNQYLQIDVSDNVAVAIHDMKEGDSFDYEGRILPEAISLP